MSLIGISNPMHRSLLCAASLSNFTDNVKVTVREWRDFGSVVAFTIVTRWKFFRSSIMLPFNDIKKFDTNLRKELSREQLLESKLPAFPPVTAFMLQSQKDPAFITGRKQALEVYLQGLAFVLEGTKYMHHLLIFLEVVPSDLKSIRRESVSIQQPKN